MSFSLIMAILIGGPIFVFLSKYQEDNKPDMKQFSEEDPLTAKLIKINPADFRHVPIIGLIIGAVFLLPASYFFVSWFQNHQKAAEYSQIMGEFYQREANSDFGAFAFFAVIAVGAIATDMVIGKVITYEIVAARVKAKKNEAVSELTTELLNEASIPKDSKPLFCLNGLKHIEEYSRLKSIPLDENYVVRVWKDGNDLLYTFDEAFFQSAGELYLKDNGNFGHTLLDKLENKLPVFTISHHDFLFYTLEGDFYIKTDVSGSGGGSDYGKALVGGALFGGAGAVVASRKEVNINTTTTEVDKRSMVLYYQYNNAILDAYFDSSEFKVIKKLFPSKDAAVLDRLTKNQRELEGQITQDKPTEQEYSGRDANKNDIADKLDKLVTLQEKGYITEEEYQARRERILDNI